MRKALAIFLLFSFGIMVPSWAMPVRLCLIEKCLLVVDEPFDCCPDCQRESGDEEPCCVDLEALPDTSVPHSQVELPPIQALELPDEILPGGRPVDDSSTLMRGLRVRDPISPEALRALFGVWRL